VLLLRHDLLLQACCGYSKGLRWQDAWQLLLSP
jgi:hypothetical protein